MSTKIPVYVSMQCHDEFRELTFTICFYFKEMYNVNKFKSLLTQYRVDDYCQLFCLDLRNEGGVEESQRSKYLAT